jgi:UPF0755 protein
VSHPDLRWQHRQALNLKKDKQMGLIQKLFALLLLVVGVVAGALFYWANEPLIEAGGKPIEFTIQAGSGVRSAMRQVNQAGVPAEPLLLEVLARGSGRANRIKAGSYRLAAGSSPLALLQMIVRGDTIQESITIIEGWTFAQMRALVSKHEGLKKDAQAMEDTQLLARLGSDYPYAEGLFYPDTYKFSRGSSDLQIFEQAHGRMKKMLDEEWAKRVEDLPYKTPYEALIMASIIEKETGTPSERDRIAAVFVNRLKRGMLLQTDPTVIYGMGANFDGNIRKQDLLTDTPYNTYKRAGLPPSPIALPGRAALQAALNPAKTNDLYFVARGDGTSQFSENLADHNKAVNQYQR